MTVAYATPAELTAWAPAASALEPAEADRLLQRASELMDHTVRMPFGVDSGTSLPADPDIAVVMRDATCAQVEYWLDSGGECTDVGGTAGTTVTIGSFTGTVGPVVAPRAERLLHNGGLMSSRHTSDVAHAFFCREAG